MSGANAPRFDAEDMLAGIRRWVELESPTDDTEAVNRMMDLAQSGYAGTGARITRIPGTHGFADHLLVETPWGGDEPGILVLSHLDTVHPVGFLNRLPFRVEGDVAYGPGIYDMKGGAYIAFHAFREACRSLNGTTLPVRHLYVSEEEVGSPTSRAIIEREARRAKYVLVTEPAREGGKIVTARKGVGRFDLMIRGRAAHSGARHQDGRSAIKELARQTLILEGLTDYERGITCNVGVVRGGTRANVVAEEAFAEIDLRVPSVELAEEIVPRILGLTAHEEGVTVTVTGGMNRPPYEKDARIEALFQHARSLAAEIGFDLQDLKTGGGSDGNFTSAIAPTLDGLGVDGKGGHTDHEQIYVSSLGSRARLMYRLFETLR
jgi:glutamate carboxypeptidase